MIRFECVFMLGLGSRNQSLIRQGGIIRAMTNVVGNISIEFNSCFGMCVTCIEIPLLSELLGKLNLFFFGEDLVTQYKLIFNLFR